MTRVAENLTSILARIRQYEQCYGRPQASVRLLAVSKQQSAASIREAALAGATEFGENYLQEAQEKIAELADLNLCWHFIGPMQSNKTRAIAELFDWVHSVDRLKIAHRLAEQRPEGRDPLNLCVQVNLSLEDSKSGIELAAVPGFCAEISAMPGVKLRGLMAIPAPCTGLDAQRRVFAPLADCFASMQAQYPTMDTLSIGMSNDFEAAIAEGSTLVRLGTALFGARR